MMTINENEFYITVQSDSSLQTYPDNKTSNFTVSLPRAINLTGDWKVALVSASYPNTIQNVPPYHDSLKLSLLKYAEGWPESRYLHLDVFIHLPIDYYSSVNEIVSLLNENTRLKMRGRDLGDLFVFDQETKKVKVNTVARSNFVRCQEIMLNGKVARAYAKTLQFEGRLGMILGFEPDTNLLNDEEIIAKFYPRLENGVSQNTYIYCDLIEPQIIGHKMAQIIKIMPTLTKNATFGEMILHDFSTRDYYPVVKKNIQEIKIDIRENTGELLPFAFGQSTLTLHFLKYQKNKQKNGI